PLLRSTSTRSSRVTRGSLVGRMGGRSAVTALRLPRDGFPGGGLPGRPGGTALLHGGRGVPAPGHPGGPRVVRRPCLGLGAAPAAPGAPLVQQLLQRGALPARRAGLLLLPRLAP